jgi:hypothetical protein
MMKKLSGYFLVVAGAFSIGGCGQPSEPVHVIHPAGAPANFKVPSTKQEKIAAVQNAQGVPDSMKKAEIAKINSEPGP